jgi:hypothetical protein
VLPADARFVLPPPRGAEFSQLNILGAPPAVAESLAASGLAREVRTGTPSRPGCDCLLLFAGADTPLEAAVEHVAPGGALYWETDRRDEPSGWSLEHVAKRLRRLGFDGLQAYWAPLEFRGCPVLLPMDRPEAIRWYLTSIHGVGVPRPAVTALRALIAAARPRLVLTAVRQRGASPINGVLRHSGIGGPEDRLALLVGGSDAYGRVALLPFSPGAERPHSVLKVARMPARNASIAHEQGALVTYRGRLRGPIRCSLPRPLGMRRWGNLLIGAETCARGRLLSADVRRRLFPPSVRDLRLVTNWLIEFQRQTRRSDAAWDAARRRELVVGPLTEFREAFGEAPGEADLFLRVAESLSSAEVPSVCQHWGLTDRNIYDDRGRISVIDWEGGGSGLPLLDLVYFAWHWYRGGRASNHFRAESELFMRLFLAERDVDDRAAAVRRAMADYVQALEIDPRLQQALLALTWVARAVGRRDRARVTGASIGELRKGNLYAEFVATLAQHPGALLSGTAA